MGNTPKFQSEDNIPGYLKNLPWSWGGNLSQENISRKQSSPAKETAPGCLNVSPATARAADCQLSIEPTLWGHDLSCNCLVAQMNMEDREKLLSENRLICRKDK